MKFGRARPLPCCLGLFACSCLVQCKEGGVERVASLKECSSLVSVARGPAELNCDRTKLWSRNGLVFLSRGSQAWLLDSF